MIHDVFKHPYWSNLVDTCMRTYALYGKQLFLRQFRNARELGPCKITVLYCNLQLSRNLFIPPKFDHLDYLSIYFFLLIIFTRFGGIFFLQQRLQKWFSIQRKDFTWHSLSFNHTLSIAYIFSPREIALAGCLDWFSSLLGFAFYRRLKMISILLKCEWYKYNIVTWIIKVSFVLYVKPKVHIFFFPVCMDKNQRKTSLNRGFQSWTPVEKN